MNISRIVRTLRYLKPIQILYQFKYRLTKPTLHQYEASKVLGLRTTMCAPIAKRDCLLPNNSFSFINIEAPFSSWNDTSNGMLWAYNLNYMDFLSQKNISYSLGQFWINSFIDEIEHNHIGLDPYPTALRGVNWIKFISRNFDTISKVELEKWNNALYSQYELLIRKLEFHLLGNHLLEDAYSLFFASIYFSNDTFYKKASKILIQELQREILPDGAHFEQSPMYHCILLNTLLDCYNFSIHNIIFTNQKELNKLIKSRAEAMLGHLQSVLYEDFT